MSYNDGYVHLDFYNQDVDREKIALDFSEGDSLLCSSLLELWENDIITTACCRGHDESSPAYVSLVIDDNSEGLIQATCEYLYLQEGRMELNFTNGNNDYDTFTVYMASEEDKESYLNFLQQVLKHDDAFKSADNNIPVYAKHLLMFARGMGLNCRYGVEKDQMMFGYSHPGEFQFFDNDAPALSDLNDSIRKTGNLPLRPISCDEKSLEQFINLIYPDTFTQVDDFKK